MGYPRGNKYSNETNDCLNTVTHKTNTMWEAIAYVSSGLTLTAFLAAVAAWVYKNKSEEKERLLRTAPQSQRAKLVEQALESFHVDTSKCNKEQQYDLAVQQIQARSHRFRWTATIIVILVLIAAAVAIYAIYRITAPNPEALPEQTKPLAQTLSGSIHNETNDPLPDVQVAPPELGYRPDLQSTTEVASANKTLTVDDRPALSLTVDKDQGPVAVASHIAVNLLPKSAAPGETVLAEIVVSNDGMSTENDLTVNFIYPDGLANLTKSLITGPFNNDASCHQLSGSSSACTATELLKWNIGNLVPGQTIRITVPFTIFSSARGGDTITFDFTLMQNTTEVASANKTLTVDDRPALSLTIDENQDPVAAGDTLIYTLSYGNISESSVSSTTLTFAVPRGVMLVSASSGGTFSGGEVSWDLGTLAAGHVGVQTVTVSIDASMADGTLIKAASLINGIQNFLPTERAMDTVTSVNSSVPLTVNLSLRRNSTTAGATERDVEILVSNSSATMVFGASMEMRFPVGLAPLSESLITGPFDGNASCRQLSGSSSTCTATELLQWNLGNLTPGQTIRMTMPLTTASGLADGSIILLTLLVMTDNIIQIEKRATYVIQDL